MFTASSSASWVGPAPHAVDSAAAAQAAAATNMRECFTAFNPSNLPLRARSLERAWASSVCWRD